MQIFEARVFFAKDIINTWWLLKKTKISSKFYSMKQFCFCFTLLSLSRILLNFLRGLRKKSTHSNNSGYKQQFNSEPSLSPSYRQIYLCNSQLNNLLFKGKFPSPLIWVTPRYPSAK